MAFKPMKIKYAPPPELQERRLDRIDGGVNYKYIESQIGDLQSPWMINLNADDRGALTKRWGQKWVYTNSLGAGAVNAIFDGLFKGKKVFTWGDGLYTQINNEQPIKVYSGLANNRGTFFVFSDLLCYINGANFIAWDGTTATTAESRAYVPTLTLGRSNTGGGTAYEQWNLLTPKFKDSFSPDGTATAFSMSLTNLDSAAVKAWILGVEKTEGVDFSVNRTTGIVTFNVAPGQGTNTLIIQAEKTQPGFADRVKKCKYVSLYGGATNDSRLFMAGSDDYTNLYRYTGLTGNPAYDAFFWPENNFNRIGSDYKAITGFSKYYGKLLIFKEDSIYSIKYSFNGSTSTFPVESLNAQMGCDMPGTIQIIGDAPVFCNTQYGVHTIVSTLLENEKNIKPLSANIDGAKYRPGILDEAKTDLYNATSVDYGGKYWLCIGSKVWVWDYKLSPYPNGQTDDTLKWFYYENINANCWAIIDRELYCGSRSTGNLSTFHENYNDFGQPIPAVWRSKIFNFDMPDWLKTVTEIWFETRAGNNTTITIKYTTDNDEIVDSETIKTESFSWASYSWAVFTWAVYKFAVTRKRKPKLKKISKFQIEFSNNELNKNLSIMSLVMRYSMDAKVK